jgi:hypothetical protein
MLYMLGPWQANFLLDMVLTKISLCGVDLSESVKPCSNARQITDTSNCLPPIAGIVLLFL